MFCKAVYYRRVSILRFGLRRKGERRRTLEYLEVVEEAIFGVDIKFYPGHGHIHFKEVLSVTVSESRVWINGWLTVYAVEDLTQRRSAVKRTR